MKKHIILFLVALCIVAGTVAQTTPATPAQVVETMYILPKRGMEEKFEAAVKAHDDKYHPAGAYVAGLRKVEYGEKAGWYLWVFGPTTYDKLDSRPAKENGHAQDWQTTIDPLVEEYGQTNLWNMNLELSYGRDILMKSKYYEAWMIDLKRGEYYRFKELAEKLKKTYESLGTTAFIILDNPIHQANGPDVVILWSFNTYKEWADDPGPKAAYEKIYGPGSWDLLMREWMDMLVDYNTEIRSFVR